MDSANSVAIIVCTLERARPPRERCLHAIRRSEHRLNKSFLASISNRSIDRSLLTVRPSVSLRASPSSEQCNADFPLTFSPNWKASQFLAERIPGTPPSVRSSTGGSAGWAFPTTWKLVSTRATGTVFLPIVCSLECRPNLVSEPVQDTLLECLFFLFFFPPNESENDEIHHRDDLPWREC